MLHAKHINHFHLQSNFSLKMYMHTYHKNYRRVLKTLKGALLPYLSDKTWTLSFSVNMFQLIFFHATKMYVYVIDNIGTKGLRITRMSDAMWNIWTRINLFSHLSKTEIRAMLFQSIHPIRSELFHIICTFGSQNAIVSKLSPLMCSAGN